MLRDTGPVSLPITRDWRAWDNRGRSRRIRCQSDSKSWNRRPVLSLKIPRSLDQLLPLGSAQDCSGTGSQLWSFRVSDREDLAS